MTFLREALILIVDYNGLQSSTFSKDTHPTLNPIYDKLKAFGWVTRKCNGHDIKDIYRQFKFKQKNKPFALICKTTKGFPIKYMMNVPIWHYRSPSKLEYLEAIKILNNYYKK